MGEILAFRTKLLIKGCPVPTFIVSCFTWSAKSSLLQRSNIVSFLQCSSNLVSLEYSSGAAAYLYKSAASAAAAAREMKRTLWPNSPISATNIFFCSNAHYSNLIFYKTKIINHIIFKLLDLLWFRLIKEVMLFFTLFFRKTFLFLFIQINQINLYPWY